MAQSPTFSTWVEDDLEQELKLHLLRKADRYDASKSTPVTFASRLIERKAASMARAERARKRGFGIGRLSLHQMIADRCGENTELLQLVDESAGRCHTGQRRQSENAAAEIRIDVDDARRILSPTLKSLAALLGHIPQFAAGEVLGLSRRQTAAQVAEIRALFHARGLCA